MNELEEQTAESPLLIQEHTAEATLPTACSLLLIKDQEALMAPCPVCKKMLSSISAHLSTVHHVENVEEKKILIQLANQKVSILTSPCPVPGCGYQKTRLDRHLTSCHRDLSDQARERYIQMAQRIKAITLLRELRASSPNVPMATRLDLAAADESSTPDYDQVLESAKSGVLDISCRLGMGQQVEESQQTLFRYVCEAILLKEHQLAESAVLNFKVEHWVSRTPSTSGIFLEHFDISLTPQHEEWLEMYFTHIRSWRVKKSSPDVHDGGIFFLSQKGVPVVNLPNDMKRLWELYPQASGTDLPAVAPVAPLPAVAPASSCQPSSAAGSEEGDDEQPSCSDAVGQATGQPQAPKRDHSPSSSSIARKRRAKSTWLSFLDLFPVTVHATTPTCEEIVGGGFDCESFRYFHNKWRTVQREQRIQYILDKCKFRNRPSEARVYHRLRAENWSANCPSAMDVVKSWLPVKEHIKSPDIIRRIQEQSWKGLCLKDFGPPKNKGVIATMPFSKGEVVCDYHGEYVTQEEENRRMQQLFNEACYVFFFAGRGEKFCIDAQHSPCQCHPHQDTFGRWMNHSRRSPNVKPHMFKLPLTEGTRWHPIFLALTDIQVNEELLWDYGVLSDEGLGGETVGLDWLNT
ncbi:uncharacterized protein LOC125801676 [Astyanax mexicanus]|uniref:uncharacterized protein LOC125801676 n=1 Tax=Astyanax mexicanus TaxID=7994 RepID=UPI0020CB4104|nr:uncharacterized protein LOC125801676 [Astyanax mexicanus]